MKSFISLIETTEIEVEGKKLSFKTKSSQNTDSLLNLNLTGSKLCYKFPFFTTAKKTKHSKNTKKSEFFD